MDFIGVVRALVAKLIFRFFVPELLIESYINSEITSDVYRDLTQN